MTVARNNIQPLNPRTVVKLERGAEPARTAVPVCTENLSSGVAVVKSAQDGA
jgi:hypothetical protein